MRYKICNYIPVSSIVFHLTFFKVLTELISVICSMEKNFIYNEQLVASISSSTACIYAGRHVVPGFGGLLIECTTDIKNVWGPFSVPTWSSTP